MNDPYAYYLNERKEGNRLNKSFNQLLTIGILFFVFGFFVMLTEMNILSNNSTTPTVIEISNQCCYQINISEESKKSLVADLEEFEENSKHKIKVGEEKYSLNDDLKKEMFKNKVLKMESIEKTNDKVVQVLFKGYILLYGVSLISFFLAYRVSKRQKEGF